MAASVGKLFQGAEAPAVGERFDTLLQLRELEIERIVSGRAVTPTDYLQPQDEWVLLVQGDARLVVAGASVTMTSGDHVFLPAGVAHRVAEVSAGAIWLAVHLHPRPEGSSCR